MAIFAVWHGGYSYAHGSIDEDLEVFPSIAAAGRALKSRETRGYSFRQTFAYVSKPVAHDFCPCVEGSEMTVYLSDPREAQDPYPDFILSIGPRGGVKKEVC